MTLSEELAWRGFVNQTTFGDPAALDGEPITFYWGVDPSADSMTVGNLAAAMMVRHFIEKGHKAILLVGGATGLIGDPDGKKTERELQSPEQIANNKKKIAAQYGVIFAGQKFEMVDNYDWFKTIGYLHFLRDIGKHVPMRQMLGRDFVQSRLGEGGAGISYAEFSYSLIQGYDFLHLFREKGVTLQVCGADQWGNSITGVDLIRRIEGQEAHVWSAPLVVNPVTGAKFGKSEEGAIWLDPEKTTPYKFYQFWLNVGDESAEGHLKTFTLLGKPEIERTMESFHHDRGGRLAQKTLAYEVTKLVHGPGQADSVKRASEVLFGSEDFLKLGEAELKVLREELPVVKGADTLVRTLVKAGLASSNSEASRFISSGAVYLNGEKAALETNVEPRSGGNLLRRGKNSFAIVGLDN
jgi:tyrosyl-tRNA synthetase